MCRSRAESARERQQRFEVLVVEAKLQAEKVVPLARREQSIDAAE
jgi:hypothetical protein